MTILFWVITGIMLALVIGSFTIWLKLTRVSLGLMVGIIMFAYAGYYFTGNSHYLAEYYSIKQQQNREQRTRLQPLLTEVKKQEYKLRFHLEEFPRDALAESQLLELIGLQALQAGDKALAKQYLKSALEKILPSSPEKIVRREHLSSLIKIAEDS